MFQKLINQSPEEHCSVSKAKKVTFLIYTQIRNKFKNKGHLLPNHLSQIIYYNITFTSNDNNMLNYIHHIFNHSFMKIYNKMYFKHKTSYDKIRINVSIHMLRIISRVVDRERKK